MKTTLVGAALVAVVGLAGCGGGNSMSGMNGMSIAGSSPAAAAFAGRWVGTLSDSGGSMMGSRAMGSMMNGAMMGRATWMLSDDGATVTGYMDMAPFGGSGRMQMTGTRTGDRWNVNMTIPAGMMSETDCSSTAVGTCVVAGGLMTGTYSGTNSCTGAFSGGSLTMTRQP